MRFSPSGHHSAGFLMDTIYGDGVVFPLGFPEAIGDIARPVFMTPDQPVKWTEVSPSEHLCEAVVDGELAYAMRVKTAGDTCDVEYALTNNSGRHWAHGMAFNCFNCGYAPPLRDNEGLRNYIGVNGEAKPLAECPRVFSNRPGVQLYSVAGQPPGSELPFVAGFQATPADFAAAPWMIMESKDGRSCAATISTPGLFLFQNSEYSCIHSATGFGRLAPGETSTGSNRMIIAEMTLAEMVEEMRGMVG